MLFTLASLCLFAGTTLAQRIALLTPDDAEGSKTYAAKLESTLDTKVKIIDDSLARSAFAGVGVAAPYNLSLDEAKRVGQAIGCEFFVLVRSAVQRRSSFQREEYYDGYAVLFVVSSKTGRLISQPLTSEIAGKPKEALAALDATIPTTANSLVESVRAAARSEIDDKPRPPMEEPPEENSTAAKNFRAPVPFRRVKPEYTELADHYEVTATIDMLVDLDANGHVLRTEITRWAGYDLDRSVEKAVRSMNWRPAERDGKFVPMRFLVRYNFKKIEKPQK